MHTKGWPVSHWKIFTLIACFARNTFPTEFFTLRAQCTLRVDLFRIEKSLRSLRALREIHLSQNFHAKSAMHAKRLLALHWKIFALVAYFARNTFPTEFFRQRAQCTLRVYLLRIEKSLRPLRALREIYFTWKFSHNRPLTENHLKNNQKLNLAFITIFHMQAMKLDLLELISRFSTRS